MTLLARRVQQRSDVVETLRLAQSERGALERDGPELPLTAEQRGPAEAGQREDLDHLSGDPLLQRSVELRQLRGLLFDGVVIRLDPKRALPHRAGRDQGRRS